MDRITQAFAERDRGAYPISIGTSLALEAAAGVYPDRPENPAPIKKVDEVWLNLRTIVRNLLGAVPTAIRDSMLPSNALDALIEDVLIIRSVVEDISNRAARAVIYHRDYRYLAKAYPKASLREPKTPKQIQQQGIEDALIKLYLRQVSKEDVVTFDGEIRGDFPRALIITHLPVDLLAKYRFKNLLLLESHSGKIKQSAKWNTKLTNGKELDTIPFCAFSLQVFGDNNYLFSSKLPSLKKAVLAMAQADRWTPLTTEEKIRTSVKKVTDAAIRTELEGLL